MERPRSVIHDTTAQGYHWGTPDLCRAEGFPRLVPFVPTLLHRAPSRRERPCHPRVPGAPRHCALQPARPDPALDAHARRAPPRAAGRGGGARRTAAAGEIGRVLQGPCPPPLRWTRRGSCVSAAGAEVTRVAREDLVARGSCRARAALIPVPPPPGPAHLSPTGPTGTGPVHPRGTEAKEESLNTALARGGRKWGIPRRPLRPL